jgi:ADP-ribose pyrophosphatase
MPDGRTTLYGVIECRGAVGVLPFLDDGRVVLVGQYRYVARDFRWEMPTGAVHAGEDLEAAVRRELREEAGYEAGRLVQLCRFHTSKSVVDETAHLYLAEALRPAAGIPPDQLESVIGCRAARTIAAGEILSWNDVVPDRSLVRRGGGS